MENNKQNNDLSNQEIGLFFYIKGKLYGWGKEINGLKQENNFINIDLSHVEYFDQLVEVFPELNLSSRMDYGEFPRGRVIYRVNDNRFLVYLDKCLYNDEKVKSSILREFNLLRNSTDFILDEHYICAGCSEETRRVVEIINGKYE